MTARDDYRRLATVIDRSIDIEIIAALDEIDRLRAELSTETPRGRLVAVSRNTTSRDRFPRTTPTVRVGFTGTRKGLTDPQRRALIDWFYNNRISEFHQGCCVGADAEAFWMAFERGTVLHAHLPTEHKLLDVTVKDASDVIHPERSYHERNRDIVDACDVLVACPAEMTEQAHGGTWYTVRYARRKVSYYDSRPASDVVIIWPDGTLTPSPERETLT